MTAKMETQVTMEHLKLSEDQIDMLARPLVHIIAAFFEDPLYDVNPNTFVIIKGSLFGFGTMFFLEV